jgi:2,3-bisphosphoglycerate-independent phosphoglycerate mutase
MQLIAVVDEFFFGELLAKLDLRGHVVCVASDHATPCKIKAHSDDPVPVLISGDRIRGDKISKFSEKDCRRGSLGILRHGTQLMPKLMRLIEERKILRKG